MADERKKRTLEDGLLRLVEALLPELPDEDDDAFSTRREQTLEGAKERLFARNYDPWYSLGAALLTQVCNRNNSSSLEQEAEIELGPHVSDLIKAKLVHDNSSPEPVLRYQTLFTRLTALPVLDRKWEVLYLLYLLSGSPASASVPRNIHNGAYQTSGIPVDETIESANFLGLHRLPNRARTDPSGGLENRNHSLGQWGMSDGDERKTKALLLEENGFRIEPSEATLLSSMPFTLLGLSSTSLPFSPTGLTAPEPLPANNIGTPDEVATPAPNLSSDFFPATKLVIPQTLPLPIVSLLHTLAEPSLLYHSLNGFAQDTNDKSGGLVGQSLRAAIGQELRGYISLVGGLEGEIRRAVSTVGLDEGRGIGKAGVTLKRCVVWTREATMGLRLMSQIVEKAKNIKGGQLISSIHTFSSSHGDPFVHTFAERLLAHVTRPFYNMLRRWVYDGELDDPYFEFFVFGQPDEVINTTSATEGRKGAINVWEDKYKITDHMIPTIITQDFAQKVFLIGKSLNFIRHSCADSDWVDSYSKDASKELRYGDTAALESTIDEAYKTTMARLIHLMAEKFQLFDHLQALKRYLLLGQGDFIALLMESLSGNLDRPANSLYRHQLTGQLEHAIRNSNAQFEHPDVIRRLDARMLELSHGEVGWEVFTLEYKVEAPVDVIVTPYAGRQYLKVFNFLWRIKRVEYALGSAWRRYMTGARGVLRSVQDKVGEDWKVSRCVAAEMIHFVCQLQYYILFEVIEKSWSGLQKKIRKEGCTLDDIIQAHAWYLEQITRKGLLDPKSSSRSSSEDSNFLAQLHEILKLMLQYKEAMDGLYGYSVAEFTRRQELSARIETRTKEGRWGLSEQDILDDDISRASTPLGHRRTGRDSVASNYTNTSTLVPNFVTGGGEGDSTLPSLRSRMKGLAADFKARVVYLLGDLMYQSDLDTRLLGVLVNFNGVYEVQTRRRKKPREAGDKEKKGDEKGEKLEGREEKRSKRDRSERARDGASSAGSGRVVKKERVMVEE